MSFSFLASPFFQVFAGNCSHSKSHPCPIGGPLSSHNDNSITESYLISTHLHSCYSCSPIQTEHKRADSELNIVDLSRYCKSFLDFSYFWLICINCVKCMAHIANAIGVSGASLPHLCFEYSRGTVKKVSINAEIYRNFQNYFLFFQLCFRTVQRYRPHLFADKENSSEKPLAAGKNLS